MYTDVAIFTTLFIIGMKTKKSIAIQLLEKVEVTFESTEDLRRNPNYHGGINFNRQRMNLESSLDLDEQNTSRANLLEANQLELQ